MEQPIKAFVISLSKIQESADGGQAVLDTLLSFGIDAELFEGTYGNNAVKLYKDDNRIIAARGIKTNELTALQFKEEYPDIELPPEVLKVVVRNKIDQTGKFLKVLRPGVIGCFYSHYRLWQRCVELDEPILIFEDDVIFKREYMPVSWDEVLLLCTGKEAHKHDFYSKKLYDPSGEPSTVTLPNTSMPGAVGYGVTPKGAKKLVEFYKKEFLPADTAMNTYVVKLECHTHLMGRAATEDDGKVSLTTTRMWGKFE
jgi:GR25 family glycosyltransferase involved in LPS biosynthesis